MRAQVRKLAARPRVPRATQRFAPRDGPMLTSLRGPLRPPPRPAPQLPFAPRRGGANAIGRVNTEGYPMLPGSGSYAGTLYCGRRLGQDAIPGSDGRCGPNNGPQCASCRAAAAAGGGSVGAAGAAGGHAAAGGWLAAAVAVPRRFVPPRAHPVESAADLEVGCSAGLFAPLRLLHCHTRLLYLHLRLFLRPSASKFPALLASCAFALSASALPPLPRSAHSSKAE